MTPYPHHTPSDGVISFIYALADTDSLQFPCRSSCSSCASSCPAGYSATCMPGQGLVMCNRYFKLTEACFTWSSDPNVIAPLINAGCISYANVPARDCPPSMLAVIGDDNLAPLRYSVSSTLPRSPYPGIGLPLSVRSVADPWVVALQVTGGTGSFGMSRRQRAVVGIALLASGGSLICLLCAVVCAVRRCCAHRWRKYYLDGDGGLLGDYSNSANVDFVVMQQPQQVVAVQPFYGAPGAAAPGGPQQVYVQAQPAYAQPAYVQQQPYAQPVYAQPTYAQPVYPQPVYYPQQPTAPAATNW